MNLYAVCQYEDQTEGVFTIMFFWAEDPDHAAEQAVDASPDEVVSVARIPGDIQKDNEGQYVIYTGRYDHAV